MVEAPEIFDRDDMTGTGFYEGSRGCFSGKVAYLLGHAIMMDKEKAGKEAFSNFEDVDDYVDQKFKQVQLKDKHQVIGGMMTGGPGSVYQGHRAKRGGQFAAIQGAGSIGTFMFDPSRAMTPYGNEASGSRNVRKSLGYRY